MSSDRSGVNGAGPKTDDVGVSARDWRAVREGETHTAAIRTSSNRTPESFIVGVGASGILLAGAAITFVTLVGLVSFNVWPAPQGLPGAANIELSPAPAKVAAAAPVATAAPVIGVPAQLASAVAPTGAAGGGAAGGAPGAGSGPGGGHHGSTRTGTAPVAPNPPGNGNGPGNGQGRGNGNGEGTGSTGPVSAGKQKVTGHRSHPTHSHQAEVAQARGGHGHGKGGGSDDGGPPGQSGKPDGPPGQSKKQRGGGSNAPGHSLDSSGHGRGHGPKGLKH